MAQANFLLRAVDLSFSGSHVLRELNLSVERAEIVCLVGPSGSGKTSLLRLLNGTLRPTRGEVLVDGVDLSTLAPKELRRARVQAGFIHQDHALVPNVRVLRNVLAGRLGRVGLMSSLRDMLWPRHEALAEVHALLERVGIEEKLFERTDTLSGGQQQRVAIARALYQEPEALLADEPVASVDPARARALIALLVELARERGLTLLVSLHDLQLAREFFPRMVGLRRGRIVLDAASEEVPESAFRELYELS